MTIPPMVDLLLAQLGQRAHGGVGPLRELGPVALERVAGDEEARAIPSRRRGARPRGQSGDVGQALRRARRARLRRRPACRAGWPGPARGRAAASGPPPSRGRWRPSSAARRFSSESKEPLLMKLSTTRRFTARRSTRSQNSNIDLNGPPAERAVRIASTAPSPTFLMAASPKRMACGAFAAGDHREEHARDSLHVRRQHRDAHGAALADVLHHLVRVRALRRQQGGHEVGRVVRLQVGRLVGEPGVGRGVGLVEAVPRELLHVVPDLRGLLLGDAAVRAALEELALLGGHDVGLLLAHRLAQDVRFARACSRRGRRRSA